MAKCQRSSPDGCNAVPQAERIRQFGVASQNGFVGPGCSNFRAAVLAGPPRVVVPEIEHRLAEMLDDVAAIEVDVFHERPAIFAVENDVFMFSRRAAALDHHAERVGRPHRRVRDVRRNEERFTFAHEMIDDLVAFADAHFDVALQLIEIFFGIDQMKIVPRVRAHDDHDEKVASIVEITIAHRRLEEMTVLFDPVVQIDRRLDGSGEAGFGG